ncbi:MAG TPA: MarR family transcriptional regulator [Bryobacteraceae bacterium]|jgi:DNA-binding MarR family transcriptional regulator|nr:MarR family transcriptional regulator [Bryobacteraceae bacterium]
MMSTEATVSLSQYRSLAEFRYRIRKFLAFSEQAARAAGLEPQQHQLLLAVKGFPGENPGPTIGYLAERLQIRHHSTVELVDRMVQHDFVRRRPGKQDRRQVIVELTASGEKVLAALSAQHVAEIRQMGPGLVAALQNVLTDL